MECSCSVYVTTLVYLDRITARLCYLPTRESFHYLFFTCLLLARKLLEDSKLYLAYVAEVVGLVGVDYGPYELHKLELFVCASLDWDLHVSQTEFEVYFSQIKIGSSVTSGVLFA